MCQGHRLAGHEGCGVRGFGVGVVDGGVVDEDLLMCFSVRHGWGCGCGLCCSWDLSVGRCHGLD